MGQKVEFDSKTPNPESEKVFDVSPQEVLAKKSELHLVDVRRPDEYHGELGHVSGSELMVLDTLPERWAELPKDKTIVFICRSGARSARAAEFVKENGLDDVYNMQGGMLLWNELGYETEES